MELLAFFCGFGVLRQLVGEDRDVAGDWSSFQGELVQELRGLLACLRNTFKPKSCVLFCDVLRNKDIVIFLNFFFSYFSQIRVLHCLLGGLGWTRSLLPHCSLVLSITVAPVMIRFFLRNQMPACKCDFLLCKDYFKKNKLSLKKISRSKRKLSFKSHLYCRQRQEILSVSAG